MPDAPSTMSIAAVTATAKAAPARAPASLRTLIDESPEANDIDRAYATLAARWGSGYERRSNEAPCEAVRRSGLDCIARRGTWNVIRRFDLPAVLEIVSTSGIPRFLAVVSADDHHATVHLGSRAEVIALDEIERAWDGAFVLLWKPPRIGMEPIGLGATGADVAWLRQRLAVLDGQPASSRVTSRTYDDALASRVAAFQRTHGLPADGIAGAETFARLTAVLDPARPSLRRAGPAS